MHEFLTSSTKKFSSILLFGLPGSGKGLIGKMLASAGSQFHLSSDEVLKNYPSLTSKDLTIEMWKKHISELIKHKSYNPNNQDLLIEGFPATLAQAEMLQGLLNVRHIIVLTISDENALIERLRKGQKKKTINEKDFKAELKKNVEEMEKILNFYPHHLISKVDASQKPLEVIRDVLVRLSHLLAKVPKSSE